MLSRQLSEAIHFVEAIDPAADLARTFNGLAKTGGGWKSEKQARFLLSKMDLPVLKDRNAEAWARKHGFDGHVFVATQLISNLPGRRSAKARYFSQVFVVDNGGLVARGKVKVIHPKAGFHGLELDWSNVEVNFKRTKQPAIAVDLETEKRKQVVANKPTIELIKTVPGWEGKDILVSFLKQLESGRTLTVGQMQVIQRMLPEPGVLAGDKSEWKSDLETWKRLGAKLITMMRDEHVPAERERRKEYEKAKRAWMDANGGREPTGIDRLSFWRMSEPTPDEDEKQFNRAIAEVKAKGHTSEQWIESKMVWAMGILGNRRYWPRAAMNSAAAIADQMNRAIKAKKPTKKAMDVLLWVRRINGYIDNPAALNKAVAGKD